MTSDRFSVIERQFLPFPGTCAICGSNQRDCVDFGINKDYEGAFLMCLECAREMSNVDELDLIRREEVVHLMEDNDIKNRQMAMAVDAMEDMQRGLVASVDTYISRVRSLTPDDVVDAELPAEDKPNLL
jgi:hypothetical protein